MPIKISAMTPQKKILSEADPSGDTYVMIKPVSYRDDMARGEFLKEREIATGKGINMYTLRAEELWLTYAGVHIVLESEDDKQAQPFSEGMTKASFMEALSALHTDVVLEWHSKMVEVNPDWAFPF